MDTIQGETPTDAGTPSDGWELKRQLRQAERKRKLLERIKRLRKSSDGAGSRVEIERLEGYLRLSAEQAVSAVKSEASMREKRKAVNRISLRKQKLAGKSTKEIKRKNARRADIARWTYDGIPWSRRMKANPWKEHQIQAHVRLSVAIPVSILAQAQSTKYRSLLVADVAHSLLLLGIHEVVLYEDKAEAAASGSVLQDDTGLEGAGQQWSSSMAFFARTLAYLETPPYLRKSIFGHAHFQVPDSKLEPPHHVASNEWIPYREGVSLEKSEVESILCDSRMKELDGTWVNCGLWHPVLVSKEIVPYTRVTVELGEACRKAIVELRLRKASKDFGDEPVVPRVEVVHRESPTEKGLYWGYKMRMARSLRDAIVRPFPANYDSIIGTSERGKPLPAEIKVRTSLVESRASIMVVFGNLDGLESVLRDRQCQFGNEGGSLDPQWLFRKYFNTCPNQTSRTVRTEEALPWSLCAIMPRLKIAKTEREVKNPLRE